MKYIGHLLKAHILFGDRILLEMFKEANTAVKQWLLDELGYVHETVDINNGNRIERVKPSSSASYPAIQALFIFLQ